MLELRRLRLAERVCVELESRGGGSDAVALET